MNPKKMIEEIEKQILGDLWVSPELMDSLAYLCDDCNGRFAGTDDERRAGDYIKACFRRWGLDHVAAEPFEMRGWERGEARLVLLEGQREIVLPCIALPGCRPCDLEAEIVDAGQGSAAEFERLGAAVAGKIVLTSSDGPGRGEKYQSAIEAGAAAFIFANAQPGMLAPTGSISKDLPGFGLAYEHAARIRRAVQARSQEAERFPRAVQARSQEAERFPRAVQARSQEAERFPRAVQARSQEAERFPRAVQARSQEAERFPRARLSTTSQVRTVTARNIVGEIPGTDPAEGWILAGGHYDGHDIAQGAQDNAAATAILMETARLLSHLRGHLKAGIRFVLFSGEELGLNGSYAYARDHADQVGQVRVVFNADVLGMALPLVLQTQASPELAAYLRGLPLKELDAVVYDGPKSFIMNSDHFPFSLAGLSAVWALTSHPASVVGWGHTAGDTLDKLEPRVVRQTASAVTRLLFRMASEPRDLPRGRKSPQALQQALTEAGFEKALRASGKWPF